jgi:hypothetical protein
MKYTILLLALVGCSEPCPLPENPYSPTDINPCPRWESGGAFSVAHWEFMDQYVKNNPEIKTDSEPPFRSKEERLAALKSALLPGIWSYNDGLRCYNHVKEMTKPRLNRAKVFLHK